MAEHVLITGGTGFLGQALVAQLVTSGYHCIVLSRDPKRAQGQLPEGVEARGYDDLPDAIDAVFHIAGETPAGLWTPAKKRRIYDSRIESTKRLVGWMGGLATPPHTFLCASALGIYGHRPGEVITEDTSFDPSGGFRAQVCIDWEAAAVEAEAFGIRVVQLRISNIIDPEGGYLAIMEQLYRFGLRFVWGGNDANIPWISRLDAVRLLQFALETPALSGPLHVSAPVSTTQRDFALQVNRQRGRRVWGRIPRWLMRLLMGELARAITDSQDVRPTKALAHNFSFLHPDFSTCIKEVFPT